VNNIILVSDVLSIFATPCIILHDVYEGHRHLTLFNYGCGPFGSYASMKQPQFTTLVLLMEKVILADSSMCVVASQN
jgi:hypothetical protein